MMNWLAKPLQAIENGDVESVRQIAALFLIASQGTGKGTFYHALKTIYDNYYYYIEKKRDLHDRFNTWDFTSTHGIYYTPVQIQTLVNTARIGIASTPTPAARVTLLGVGAGAVGGGGSVRQSPSPGWQSVAAAGQPAPDPL